jgi:hypothetical protein
MLIFPVSEQYFVSLDNIFLSMAETMNSFASSPAFEILRARCPGRTRDLTIT